MKKRENENGKFLSEKQVNGFSGCPFFVGKQREHGNNRPDQEDRDGCRENEFLPVRENEKVLNQLRSCQQGADSQKE